MSEPSYQSRSVKPRRTKNPTYLPVMAVSQVDDCVLTQDGEVFPLSQLGQLILTRPASMIVAENAAELLVELTAELKRLPNWQFRVSPIIRTKYQPFRSERVAKKMGVSVHYLGFKPRKVSGQWTPSKYHYPIDPLIFSNKGIHSLYPVANVSHVAKLLAWGMDIQDWCKSQNLKVSPSAGGLANQLLKDPRFYPEPRRKVPRATNDRAREVLPGNHYRLYVPTSRRYDGLYLDMKSAHHYCASRIEFPCANRLFARGHFTATDATDATDIPQAWAKRGTRRFDRIMGSHGLLYVTMTVPRGPKLVPPCMETPGRVAAWVYSNELPLLRELGADIDGIVAAWTSYDADKGLPAYAEWARGEVSNIDENRKVWLKPALLSTYGMLAARPGTMEFGFHTANGAIPTVYPVGRELLQVQVKRLSAERESNIANVIQRGMIEAQVRIEAIRLGQALEAQGMTVLALYADSVIVQAQGQLPMLPPPWSIESELTGLVFYSPVSFSSVEMDRLPGIPEEARATHRRRLEGRALAGNEAKRPSTPEARARRLKALSAYVRPKLDSLPEDLLESGL